MSRKILLFLALLLVIPLAFSQSKLVVYETEKVSVDSRAVDPDNDNLKWSYSPPLNSSGQWQTDYGDEGEYASTITVSDGESSDSKEILIVVKRKDEKPFIESYIPKEENLETDELSSIDFRVLATDLNADDLEYTWTVDGKSTSKMQEFKYSPSFKDDGKHKITIEVSDGTYRVYKDWEVFVKNVDVESLLESIPNVNAKETDIVSLILPDFEKYGLTYSVSRPIGNENKWQTGYDDAGKYTAIVHAEGNGFKKDKEVEVIIENLDRPVQFEKIDGITIRETQTAMITLSATDPDEDAITFLAQKMPNGSKFNGTSFEWTPDQDYVVKDGFFDRMMDKIGLMSKSSYIQFSAISNDKEIIQNGIITVRDLNRPPVIEDTKDITVNEGETVFIEPKIYDLDKEKFRVKYSGVSNTNSFSAGYNDAGNYTWTVSANDGKSKTTRDFSLIVQNVNRAPEWKGTDFKRVKEGWELALQLKALDPDGDLLEYFIENPPAYSQIKDDIFYYTPSYDTVEIGEKKIDLVFIVSDKSLESRKIIPVVVENTNRAPIIGGATTAATVTEGNSVLMQVNATDPDGDLLEYNWNFGLFDSYDGTNLHQRTFKSAGVKKVKVTVSDGKEETVHIIAVNVLKKKEDKKGFSLGINENSFLTDKRNVQSAKNNPPRIVAISDNVVVKQNEPAKITVRAVDDDNDPIKYSWDLKGIEYTKSGTAQMVFPKKGEHYITVLVSHGKEILKKNIRVVVV